MTLTLQHSKDIPRRRQLKPCTPAWDCFTIFSRITNPLQNLIHKDAVFNFDQNCYNAFQELKNRLIAAPVLVIYNPTKTTEFHTDASSLGFWAILMQKQDDGLFYPTAYFSKTTFSAESKYHRFIPKYRSQNVIHKELGDDRYVIREIENCQLAQQLSLI